MRACREVVRVPLPATMRVMSGFYEIDASIFGMGTSDPGESMTKGKTNACRKVLIQGGVELGSAGSPALACEACSAEKR